MKKSLVVLLAMGAILTARVAGAVAVDFGTPAAPNALGTAINALFGDDDDQNGGVIPGPALGPNGILDRAEAWLVISYLEDPAKPNHQQIYDAWVANLARATTDIGVAAYRPGIAMYFTIGDAKTVESIVGYVQFALFKTLNPANYNLTCGGLFGPQGDADGDGYTNKEEYDAAVSNLNLAGPWADDATRDAQRALAVTQHVAAANTTNVTSLTCTVAIAPNRGEFVQGEDVTLTASAAGATGAVTYEWFKGATSVGTGATLALANVTAANAGTYTAVATDSSTPLAQHDTSNAVAFTVIDAAALPVMGVAGMALLVGLAGALGVRKIRK